MLRSAFNKYLNSPQWTQNTWRKAFANAVQNVGKAYWVIILL